MKYNVDYNKLVVLLLPTFLRKTRLIGFLKAAINPLILLHDEFLIDREEDHKKLDHNWQKCYLQKILNDTFDKEQRRILVEEDERENKRVYLFSNNYFKLNVVEEPIYLGKRKNYINPNTHYADASFDFTVNLKETITRRQEKEVEALVNFYKLESTRPYIINFKTNQL